MLETKCLGLHLTANLKCYVDIKNLSSNWTEGMMSLTILRRMYFANFHSHLTYGIPPPT
jgi:hypothetical protein